MLLFLSTEWYNVVHVRFNQSCMSEEAVVPCFKTNLAATRLTGFDTNLYLLVSVRLSGPL